MVSRILDAGKQQQQQQAHIIKVGRNFADNDRYSHHRSFCIRGLVTSCSAFFVVSSADPRSVILLQLRLKQKPKLKRR